MVDLYELHEQWVEVIAHILRQQYGRKIDKIRVPTILYEYDNLTENEYAQGRKQP